MIASLLIGCQSAPAKKRVSKERSQTVGVLLAIFPGVLVHGTGNYYAGKKDRAKELLEEEGYSVLFMGIGVGLFFLGLNSQDSADDSDGAEKTFHQVSGILSFTGAAITGVIGVFMFFDSWFRDIYETPAACRDADVDWDEEWDEDFSSPDEDFGNEKPR